jgi:hypothetical protein
MSTFVIRLSHPPDQCPASNGKVRQRAFELGPRVPELAAKHGLTFVDGPLVLDAEHEGLAVVEAANVQSVHDFVFASGLMQWNSVRVSLAQPLHQSLKELDGAPPPIY